MVKPKIACYITGGWTECGYMTRFLEKINNRYDYKQRFPQKNIGKKGKTRKEFVIDGKTGSALLKWIYQDIRAHKDEFEQYKAILIEDDMDDQFFLESKERRDFEEIENRKAKIAEEIQKILQNGQMQVFFLYALPEIEAWFISDWDNTLGLEYRNVLSGINPYFSLTFKNFFVREVLNDRYSAEEIENFGFKDSQYQKLSERLIQAFSEYSCADAVYKNNKAFNKKINELIRDNKIMYSKKTEGVNMLQRLEPEKVAAVCTYYFSKAYGELKGFGAV